MTDTLATQTILDTAPGLFGATWRLIHRTAGLQMAGSGMTPVGEAWGAIVTRPSGDIGGQWYKAEVDARAHFVRFTTPIIEAAE